MGVEPFSRIEIANLEGRAQSTRFRQKLLHSLHHSLISAEKTIKEAISMDTGYTDFETTLEYTLAISELRIHYDSLNLEDDLKNQRAVENLNATRSVGIVFITPSNQNLFYSVISGITAAITAGNCVILEVCHYKTLTFPYWSLTSYAAPYYPGPNVWRTVQDIVRSIRFRSLRYFQY
jgi:acyl-CoA reductase-like NAD-dependent aldehyde dehydrogenase